MRIARVFPTKTKMCPTDKDSYFGPPLEDTPIYDEVHISVTFTWDLNSVPYLQKEWARHGKVRVGGPALDDPGGLFVSGMYLNPEVTITSRGCPNNCPFCFVPKREGKIRELPIQPGRIIQDNNLLACSDGHLQDVFTMLKAQKKIDFSGGLEASRINDGIAKELKKLSIYQIWTAFDIESKEKIVEKAITTLRQYFTQNQIRCYVLIGFEGDTVTTAEGRLRRAYEMGALPFAMLYHTHIEWKKLQRKWARPAIYKQIIKDTSFLERL